LRSELDRALRRLRPDRRRTAFARRPDAELAFVEHGPPFPTKLLLDTTVYIDELQGRAGAAVELALRACDLWHASVAAAELALALGRLDPADARTRKAAARCRAALERIPGHKVLTPDGVVWCEAGIAAGILARTQGYGRDARLRALNDALILLTARKHGCAVLTRNVADFDVLSQLIGGARAVFYRTRC
jgi:predicted nucleic acid-binding protein